MLINTHLLFSKIIYKHCLKELHFKLNKSIFMYGNIKPDILFDHSKYSHTLNESIDIISQYSHQLINNKSSISKFSLTLGVICHYICDSFCIYHTEAYKNKNIFKHLLYELIIHFFLVYLLIKGNLKFIHNRNLPKRNISAIIYKMQRKYFQINKSLLKDITYSLSTAIWVAESIIFFSINNTKNFIENETESYKLLKDVGVII